MIGDLNSRRGMILGMDAIPGAQQVNARCPCLKCLAMLRTCALDPGPWPVHHGARSLRGGSQEHF